MRHKAVLLREAVNSLNLRPGLTVVDGTLGSGGHAQEILKIIGPRGRLIAFDQDPAAIERCKRLFDPYPNVQLQNRNFRHMDTVLDSLGIREVDAGLLDLGFSSDQLEDPERGFSFARPGPLDMRMGAGISATAADLISDLSQEQLERLFREYGEEPRARRIARHICNFRQKQEIRTTEDLAAVVNAALPGGKHTGARPGWARRHPATRVFQALRIAVNDELGSLKEALPKFWSRLDPGGRLSIISFHSLEDRIVKYQFREWVRGGEGRLLTKKPVTAPEEEVRENSRARSAKLRTVEKIPHEIRS